MCFLYDSFKELHLCVVIHDRSIRDPAWIRAVTQVVCLGKNRNFTGRSKSNRFCDTSAGPVLLVGFIFEQVNKESHVNELSTGLS